MVRPKYIPAQQASPFLAVHVRLGDFASPANAADIGQHSVRRPAAWYRDALVTLRETIGADMRAIVYSAGQDSEIAEILALPDVGRTPKRESITDMLEMSQARALIATSSVFLLGGLSRSGAAHQLPGELTHALADADLRAGWRRAAICPMSLRKLRQVFHV